MFDTLTDAQSDALWWRVVRAIAAVSDEVDSLSLAPVDIRDMLYGKDCLAAYTAMAGELAELAAELADSPLERITVLAITTPEEGSEEWQSGTETPRRPAMTWSKLAARVTLRRAWRRLTPMR